MVKRCKRYSVLLVLTLLAITIILMGVPSKVEVYAQETDFQVTAVNLAGDVEEKVTFSGGEISEQTAPDRGNTHKFTKAYVKDAKSDKPVEIVSADVRDGRVYFRLKDETQENLERSYLLADGSEKIFFEYRDIAKTIKVTYQPDENQDIIVTGPDTIELYNGTATGTFTVSVPRQNNIIIDSSIAEVTLDEDISTPERTVYRFKISTDHDLNIPISSVAKQGLTLTAKKTYSDDWEYGGYPSTGYYYKDAMIITENVTDADIEAGRNINQSSLNFQYGNTVHLKAYSDRTLDTSQGTFSTFLSVIWLNGQPIGIPQPLSRFGPSRYPDETGNPYNRPTYEGASTYLCGTSTCLTGGAGFQNQDKLVSTFSRPQGWDAYNYAYWSSMDDRSYRSWYGNVIFQHVIGQKTVVDVDHGPLAGAKITVTITDAKPDNYTEKLNSWGYDSNGDVRHEDIFQLNDQKFNDEKGQDKGYHNSLRLAYDIKIENAPVDITATTEWATTSSSKVGMYLNYGVEDVEVYASNLNDVSTPESQPSWQPMNSGWLTSVGLGGGNRHGSYTDLSGKAQQIKDPMLAVRGNVKNGYTQPIYRDDTVSPIHRTWTTANTTANSPEGAGKGFYGKYPVYAQAALGIGMRDSTYVKTAGMNVVGIEAKLLHLPVDYQLEGGTVEDTSLFPTKDVSLTQPKYLYDVEGNPIIHIPTAIPHKDGAQFSHWEVLKLNGDEETEIGYSALPGEDINILDTNLFGRITYNDGTVNFDGVRLRAVYADGSTGDGEEFVVNHVFKENADSTDNLGVQQVGSFISVHGSDSNLTSKGESEFAKESVEFNGATYRRIDIDQGEDVEHPIGGYVPFNDTSRSIDIVYVREKRGTVKVRYEDEEGNLLPDTTEETIQDNVLVGTEYSVSKKDFDEYEFKEMKEGSAPEEGTVAEGEQTVVYVYALKRYEVPETGLDLPYGMPLLILMDALLPLALIVLLKRKRR